MAIEPAQPQDTITGEVVVKDSPEGIEEAKDFAGRTCNGYHLTAKMGALVTVGGSTRLTYTCE